MNRLPPRSHPADLRGRLVLISLRVGCTAIPGAGPRDSALAPTTRPLWSLGRVGPISPRWPWTREAPEGRTFLWTAKVRTALRIPAPGPVLSGTLRLSASGLATASNGREVPYQVTSSPVRLEWPYSSSVSAAARGE